jgi:photosystem II stability/assembly factor-like uncharacterized protein
MPEIDLSGYSRVWLIENLAAPGHAPQYQGLMKIGDPSWGRGDVARVEVPSDVAYDDFEQVAEVKGQTENPTFSIMGRYPMELSTMLRLTRQGCPLDVQAHLGKCRDPRDFNAGWEKVAIYERARITNYAIENFGALGSDERAVTNETGDLSARDWYEVVRLTFQEQGGAVVTREIISIDVCDRVQCGDCGYTSDGCQRVLATQVASGATPGTPPAVIYSRDGGATWAGVNISTLLGNENPSDSECVGGNFVVVSQTDESLHYARIDDIFLGTPTWNQVTRGFVFAKGPNAIVSADVDHSWIAAQGGYIYFTADPTQGVSVQEAGNLTVQNLNDIDALDENIVVAVGNSNVVLATDNGGITWRLITGPVVGAALTSVAIKDQYTWIVGASVGAVTGTLWVTSDEGQTWTQINLPVSGARVDDIKFSTRSVGYLSLRVTGSYARILRTINGGESWYVLPEGPGTIPNNTRLNQVAACSDANVVFGAGLSSGGTDGIIVKAA